MSLKETFLISPLSVRGCQLWLDAADTTTTTFSGSSLSQWTDKSSTGKTITITGTLTRTTNGRNGLQTLTTNGGYVSTSLSSAIGNGDYALIAVWYQSVAGTNGVVGAGINTNGNGAGIGVSGLVGGLFKYNFYQFGVGESSYQISGPTFLIQEGIRINGTNTVYINGDAGTGSTNSLNLTNTTLTVGAATSFTMSGQICEALVYVGTLSSPDREKIEGYLAWKWGLTSSLPSTHTYKNSRPLDSIPLPASLLVPSRPLNNIAYSLFRPTNVANCVLWLDGADVSTMFQNTAGTLQVRSTNSTVALWRDKSVSANHASNTTAQPTVTFAAQNGLNVLNFNGAQYLTLSTTTLPTGTTQCSFFFVTRTTSSGVQVFFTYGADPNTSGRNPQFFYNTNVLSTDVYGASGINDNTNYLNSYVITSCTFTNVNSAWDNGSPFSSGTTALTLNTGTGWASIGVGRIPPGNVLSYYLTGQIGEIIVFSRALSTSERQTVEGYLTWKWGLQTNFPLTHPFRSNPPDLPAVAPRGIAQVKSAFFNPTTFSGIQLWLDASDRATITAGSTITGWTDKSGTSRTITFAGTTNTYDPVGRSVNTDNATNSYFFANVNLKRSVTPNANVFIVYTWLGSATNANQALWGQDIGGGWNRFQLLSFPSATSIAYGLSYTPSSPNVILVNGLNTGNRLLYCANYRYLRTNGTFAYVNGIVNSTPVTEVAASPETSTTNTYFGTIDTGFSGRVAFQEILIYTTDMSELQRQSIEGYLAWKWGLVANLPSTHPFKLFPPPP